MNESRPLNNRSTEELTDLAALDAGDDRPRVLVVDDDERNLLAIRTVLEDVGDVVVAHSGEEALRHLLKGEFAVILLDVYMPGLDGYETARIVRSREQTKRIPIVFLSAVNKETEHLLRGYEMGAVDYVFKPVDAIVLRSKVAVFVDLFAKTREIERKARKEQALLDATIRANAERLKAEQDLRRAEQRQAAIIQSLPIVLYLEPLDCDPRCPKFVSGDLAAMTGYRFADVLENPGLWAERLHEDDRERVLAGLQQREREGRFSVEYRWRCADGTYKHFHDQAVLLRDANGQAIEFAGTLTDVSERRSLESQLLQAQKMDAVGKLTGGIAHDFNNLLAAVLGGIGLVERRANLPDDLQKILMMTKRAAEQGSELVRRLLVFARRQQLQPTPIDVASLHQGVDDLLKHTLGGLVELAWEIEEAPWCPYADQSQLELAMLNLVINARDALPSGGTITITLENRILDADDSVPLPVGDYVVISVVDAGCGIAPDLIEKVLEPFFTTKEIGKGTGLGLSMVYGFAKQSGGTLRLHSKLGEGTRAELWLPRWSGQAPSPLAGQPGSQELFSERSLRVLLIDDHAEVRGTTAAMLKDLGHEAVEAASGPEAIEMLGNGDSRFDVLITDYAMPRQSGTEVVRLARQAYPELPAVIITGYADAEAIGGRPTDVGLLMKPFTLAELSGAVHRAFDGVTAPA
ncbi:MAG: response regulator [Pseudomonadota bacterium]|nr:response regulator [Sphingomonas sp.]MDQ3472004.1 response regulator [Pseudomonadota bacterium]